MWIELTDADNGDACNVRAEFILAIRTLSPTVTQIVLQGGSAIEVREAPWKVAELVEMTTEQLVPGRRRAPAARF